MSAVEKKQRVTEMAGHLGIVHPLLPCPAPSPTQVAQTNRGRMACNSTGPLPCAFPPPSPVKPTRCAAGLLGAACTELAARRRHGGSTACGRRGPGGGNGPRGRYHGGRLGVRHEDEESVKVSARERLVGRRARLHEALQ